MDHSPNKPEQPNPPTNQTQTICQSCGMPLTSPADLGTNADKSKNTEYCRYCFQDGAFSKNETLQEMVESCIPFALKAGKYPDHEAARQGLTQELKALKRWA